MEVITPAAWRPSDLVFVRGRRMRGVVTVERSPPPKRSGPPAQWELEARAKGCLADKPALLWEVVTFDAATGDRIRSMAFEDNLSVLRMSSNELEADLA